MSKNPIIRLRPREGRRVRAGAPWAFSNEIVMEGAVKALAPGTPVTLADDKGASLGVGYFNPKSLIAVRLLGPPGTVLGREFLAARLKRALSLRERFFAEPFYRLVHAEGDGLPGLVIDRYGDTLVAQITTAGMERLLDDLIAALDETIAPAHILLRNDASLRALEGLDSYVRAAKGSPSRLTVEENSVRYYADLQTGQKSGWYYDQRFNRAYAARLAKGARVLDAYSYTGGFGLLAAAQGAGHVTCLDSSDTALKLAQESTALNGVAALCDFVKADVFAHLEHLAGPRERYDIVICDPPPFAPSRKDVETGSRAYRKLARLAAGVVAPGGFLMLSSCSHNVEPARFAAECAAGLARSGRNAALIHQSGAGPDHPVHPLLPETAYLKTLVYAVE